MCSTYGTFIFIAFFFVLILENSNNLTRIFIQELIIDILLMNFCKFLKILEKNGIGILICHIVRSMSD